MSVQAHQSLTLTDFHFAKIWKHPDRPPWLLSPVAQQGGCELRLSRWERVTDGNLSSLVKVIPALQSFVLPCVDMLLPHQIQNSCICTVYMCINVYLLFLGGGVKGDIWEEGMYKHVTRNLFPLLFAPLTHWIGIGSCDPVRQYASLKIQPYPREERMWKPVTRNLFPLLFVPLTHWIGIGLYDPVRQYVSLNTHWFT